MQILSRSLVSLSYCHRHCNPRQALSSTTTTCTGTPNSAPLFFQHNNNNNNMVSFTRFATTYLLAASKSSSSWKGSGSKSNRQAASSTSSRSRSSSTSRGRPPASSSAASVSGGGGTGNRNKHRTKTQKQDYDKSTPKRDEALAPPPELTHPDGPFPFYFSCRHNYETALMEEINRAAVDDVRKLATTSPSPGLVCVMPKKDNAAAAVVDLLRDLDPTYALQSVPNCRVISAESIKQLAVAALSVLELDSESESHLAQQLRAAPRGSLAVHGLVPGMFKGQRDPVLQRRANNVAQEAVAILKKGYKCARKGGAGAGGNDEEEDKSVDSTEKWILQLLLFSPEVMAASLTKCQNIPVVGGTWPNWRHPAGMANVDIVDDMPSSAYRKLLEALECQRVLPPKAASPLDDVPPVVDLGACPGGWTKALRLMGCKAIAVDRSSLQHDLMQDDMVEFVKGDAFTYEPPWSSSNSNSNERKTAPPGTWMVSDVIAYPERVAELLDRWCGGKWAERMVVTAKFQGDSIPWDALEAAVKVATDHGYDCRVKHFFNNKNEVTVMVSERERGGDSTNYSKESDTSISFLGKAMYPPALPQSNL